jgi:ABC-type transport system involved in multi-copper enzyme maturation permease subunit
MKNKKQKILIIIGVLLFLNGVFNIIDDSRILVYDITSILSGVGFFALGFFDKN